MSDHDRPETYSAYHTVATVPLDEENREVVIGLKSTGLDVHFADGEVLHFDLAGRLVRIARPNIQWRRGLSGRTVQVRRRSLEEGGSLERCHITVPHADALLEAAHRRMRLVQAACISESTVSRKSSVCADRRMALPPHSVALHHVLQQAAAFDVPAARDDLRAFRSLYHDIPILPPDQYNSLVLLASDGCRYNKCTFCDFYRDVPYRARPADQFRDHVERAIEYHGAALAARRNIFLGQANALLGPRAWRDETLRYVNERFDLPEPKTSRHQPQWWKGSPTRFTGITSFLDAFVGARIRADEFAEMRQLNLRMIFIGIETGSSALLQWLRKPADPEQMLETVRAAKEGGVGVGVILLLGAGGEPYFDDHVQATVQLIRQMQLSTGDFVYLSPLVSAAGAEYDQLAAARGIGPLRPERLAEQEQMLREGIGSVPSRRGPYVAHYEVEHFVY